MFGSPLGHDPASGVPAFRSQVDDVIGGLDDIEVVLDDDNGVPGVDELLEASEKDRHVVLTCEACKGKRFKSEVLDVRYNSKNIHEVLGMSVTEACLFFAGRPDITRKLYPLLEVGLGYLKLGQPTTTLSGGELQRIKLAYHLVHEKGKKALYLFDEPTIGLHQNDVSVLLRCFQKLVDAGHTVVVIEHNLDVIKSADHLIDLGPEGGDAGGRIVAKGTPEQVAKSRKSITAKFLRNCL